MRRKSAFTVILLVSGLAVSLPAQDAPRRSAFRSDIGLILVPVNVTDRNGRSVTGLRRENFAVFDEQSPQEIVSFTREDSPVSVGLVLDTSGSMRTTLGGLKEVIREFLDHANPEDEFSLFTVSSTPARLAEFTSDPADLENSVQRTRAGGDTALVDTIYLALTHMRAAPRPRRSLLVLSDGVDNHSRYSRGELMSLAVESDTQIYTIAIDANPANQKPVQLTEEHQGWNYLQSLSERTGGLNFRVRTLSGARDAARKAADAMRNQYVIGYRAPAASHSGKWHRIRVTADVPHASIYARSGYYSR
jgi:Ca-activated chloride channel family protein